MNKKELGEVVAELRSELPQIEEDEDEKGALDSVVSSIRSIVPGQNIAGTESL